MALAQAANLKMMGDQECGPKRRAKNNPRPDMDLDHPTLLLVAVCAILSLKVF